MSDQSNQSSQSSHGDDSAGGTGRTGRFDDEAEEREPSSTTDGPAAAGEDDPRQGSPGTPQPVGEDFPHESVRYDEPGRRRAATPDD